MRDIHNINMFTNYIFFIRNSSLRNLYSIFYLITVEIQKAIVLIIIENKMKVRTQVN